MKTQAKHTAEEIATHINDLANAIYSEYELYTEKRVPVESDYFNGLEELVTIVGSIGQYIATGEESEACAIMAYTEMFNDRTKSTEQAHRERTARKAAQAAADKAYAEAMAAALK